MTLLFQHVEEIMLAIHLFNIGPSPTPTKQPMNNIYPQIILLTSLLHLHHQHSHMNNENLLTTVRVLLRQLWRQYPNNDLETTKLKSPNSLPHSTI